MTFYILTALVIIIALAYIRKNWKEWYYKNDPVFPPPIIKRKDFYVGFYGTQDNQVEETKGSFNLLLEGQFDGPDKCVQNILDAKVDTILYVPSQVFSPNEKDVKHTVLPDAEDKLRAFFQKLSDVGALSYVKAVCPIDEPNNTVASLNDLEKAVAVVHLVAKEFPELTGLKLATFYAADKDFMGQHLFDWVGFDDYTMKANLMLSKKYEDFVASLLPHQHIMLIPGAAYGQDPVPFLNFAQANPRVIAVIGFLWLDARKNEDGKDDVGALGARSNGMGTKYLETFKAALN